MVISLHSAEIARLKAENESLRGLAEVAQKGAELMAKDAGRYRWLRGLAVGDAEKYLGFAQQCMSDSAIDEDMREGLSDV